jgi:hypothetical protein
VSRHSSGRRRLSIGTLTVLLGAAGLVVPSAQQMAGADVAVFTSAVTGTDGKSYAVTNHLVRSLAERSASFDGRREWLIVCEQI